MYSNSSFLFWLPCLLGQHQCYFLNGGSLLCPIVILSLVWRFNFQSDNVHQSNWYSPNEPHLPLSQWPKNQFKPIYNQLLLAVGKAHRPTSSAFNRLGSDRRLSVFAACGVVIIVMKSVDMEMAHGDADLQLEVRWQFSGKWERSQTLIVSGSTSASKTAIKMPISVRKWLVLFSPCELVSVLFSHCRRYDPWFIWSRPRAPLLVRPDVL